MHNTLYRFRVCQLVGKMLAYACENSCAVKTELLDATREVMLIRIKDKVGCKFNKYMCMHVTFCELNKKLHVCFVVAWKIAYRRCTLHVVEYV